MRRLSLLQLSLVVVIGGLAGALYAALLTAVLTPQQREQVFGLLSAALPGLAVIAAGMGLIIEDLVVKSLKLSRRRSVRWVRTREIP